MHELRQMTKDEIIFIVGVIYLDNLRLRRLVARIAPQLFEGSRDTAKPLSPEDFEDVLYTVKCWADDEGHTELSSAIAKMRYPTKKRRAA